jgi:hypothetical protein
LREIENLLEFNIFWARLPSLGKYLAIWLSLTGFEIGAFRSIKEDNYIRREIFFDDILFEVSSHEFK